MKNLFKFMLISLMLLSSITFAHKADATEKPKVAQKICKISFNRWYGVDNSAMVNSYYSDYPTPTGSLNLYTGPNSGGTAWTSFRNKVLSQVADGYGPILLDDYPLLGPGGETVFHPYSLHGEKFLNIAFTGGEYLLQRRENGVLVNVVNRATLVEIIEYIEFIRINGNPNYQEAINNMNISAHIL